MRESHRTRWAHILRRVQIPAGTAPGGQVETSEREKLMGMFCPEKEENKKPAVENRTGHQAIVIPSTGALQAPRQPAQGKSTGWDRDQPEAPVFPAFGAVRAARSGKTSPRGREVRQVLAPNPGKIAAQPESPQSLLQAIVKTALQLLGDNGSVL